MSSGEPNRDHHLEQLVVILSVVTGTSLPNRCLGSGLVRAIRYSGNVVIKPLLNSGHPVWLHYSGFQAVPTEPLPSNGHIRHSILQWMKELTCRGVSENMLDEQSVVVDREAGGHFSP
jgi:hypothetical protein